MTMVEFTRRETTLASDFLTDATEIALAARFNREV
jgi:hypothetical protein